MNLLVVGSGSLAISTIIEAHKRGHDVRAMRGWMAIMSEWNLRAAVQGADLVLNLHGANPKRGPRVRETLEQSVSGARQIAEAARCDQKPSIHISTDCVLGHQRITPNAFEEIGQARPDDVYGYAMSLREELVMEEGGWNVRTSFITPREGIWADVLEKDEFSGWNDALWSGSHVDAVAKRLVDLTATVSEKPFFFPSRVNIATEKPTTKLLVARHLISTFGYPCELYMEERHEDRTLEPSFEMELHPFLDTTEAELRECFDHQTQEIENGESPDMRPKEWEAIWLFGSAPRVNR
jgi:dTDP-4-dehydrorhamnose reductase